MALINDYQIKFSRWDEFLYGLFWDRKMPRNVFSLYEIAFFAVINLIALPVFWALMHVPFIWPEMLAGFVAVICVSINARPYCDCFRAIITLIAAILLLAFGVRFGAEIFGFHIETGLYYIAIAASCVALLRRLWNKLAWSQIDRMCDKYKIPHYDQKTLMDSYEGQNSHYGEPKATKYENYQEAVENSKDQSAMGN